MKGTSRKITRRNLLAAAAAAASCVADRPSSRAQDKLETRSIPTPKPATPESRDVKPGTRRALVNFRTAPFPYDGPVPSTGKPFIDVEQEGRKGRLSPRTGGIYWVDETYSDRRVLLDIPRSFTTAQPGVLVVFFHGNLSTLSRDVIGRQRVPQQVAASGLNAVLLAPQMAVDAWDSSAGLFWKQGAFSAFLDEAAATFARMQGKAAQRKHFRQLPIILVGFSGGYNPIAFALHHAPHERVVGVVLLDALYGDVDKFALWLAARDRGFFVSGFTKSSADKNAELQGQLVALQVPTATDLPPRLAPRSTVFIATPPLIEHVDFVTKAWTDLPLRDVLSRIEAYRR